jgi:hypothetical protein
VAQSIIEHEALFKISHLDQFMEGLKKVLQLVENFPTEFMDYFVYTNGDILHEDVIEAMYTDDDLSETENNIFNYFCQYIRNLSPKGLQNLLIFITGMSFPRKKSIYQFIYSVIQ